MTPTAPVPMPGAGTTPDMRALRITGVDLARALAMAGMLIAHFVWADESGQFGDLVAMALRGRSMPLFILLGGVGVALAGHRDKTADLSLLLRAVLLFALGVSVEELSEWVLVILQFYGLLFAISPVLRRLPSSVLLAAAAAIASIGAWTYQVFDGLSHRDPITYAELDDPAEIARTLLVDGAYPFFPVASFFLVGIVLGRLDLRSDRVAMRLVAVGAVLGFGTLLLAQLAMSVFDLAPTEFVGSNPPLGFDPSLFSWERLLIKRGHRQMPVWVLSALGTCLLTVGLSLLIASRARVVVSPLVSVGRLALTFYVLQLALTMVIDRPSTTTFTREFVTVAVIYLGFMVMAHGWRMLIGTGPLEAVLRFGSRPWTITDRFRDRFSPS